jgi:hypothetical protein
VIASSLDSIFGVTAIELSGCGGANQHLTLSVAGNGCRLRVRHESNAIFFENHSPSVPFRDCHFGDLRFNANLAGTDVFFGI